MILSLLFRVFLKRRIGRLLLVFTSACLLFSCDLLRESPYQVEAWTPGEGYHGDPGSVEISLLFSRESDRVRAEQAFSLTEDRKTLKGDFRWEGNRLFFNPASPLELNRDYFITLGTGAQDPKGLSLENKFEASFTTRPPGGKPKVTGTDPENGGSLSPGRGEFRVFFSERVPLTSCVNFISFSPYTYGSWRLLDEGKSACFVPRDPWQPGDFYELRVQSDFSGVSGALLGDEYSSSFYGAKDTEKPVLTKVLALLPGENNSAEEIAFEKSDAASASEYLRWENGNLLELVFSEPVDSSSVKDLLSAEPAAALVMESPPGSASAFRFRLAEQPKWGSALLFRLGPGVKDESGNESAESYTFRIRCSGPLSKPPRLAGIRLPLAPGKQPETRGGSGNQRAAFFSPGDLFSDLPIESGEGRYPYMEKINTWIELYFETAEGTEIDPFSVMELFRVEATNQALSFSPRSVSAEDFTWTHPKEGLENFARIEVRGVLINMVHSGVVSFCVPAGLKDKRGNRNGEDFRITLTK